jgi:hypothetical protein
MALFLEESLYRGAQWVVVESNDEPLWARGAGSPRSRPGPPRWPVVLSFPEPVK